MLSSHAIAKGHVGLVVAGSGSGLVRRMPPNGSTHFSRPGRAGWARAVDLPLDRRNPWRHDQCPVGCRVRSSAACGAPPSSHGPARRVRLTDLDRRSHLQGDSSLGASITTGCGNWPVNDRPASTEHDTDDQEPVVLVVDDDASVREAIRDLLQSVDLRVALFRSPATFLQADLPDTPCCIVLDVRLPGQSGLELQAELVREDIRIPIIFLTGHGDVPMTVRALKAGAIDFLEKPFRDQDLLDAVSAAIDIDRKRRNEDAKRVDVRARYEALTGREQQVMKSATDGLLNKQIAYQLGISEITVKIHRGNVMRKMGAKSLPDLVRMAAALGLDSARSTH